MCVFALGLTRHLYTRMYVPEHAEAEADARSAEPLLASLDADRRGTLMAKAGPTSGTYRFDIRFQGDEETVFLDFRRPPGSCRPRR